MLKLVDQMKTTAVELGAQGDSLQAQARNMTDSLRQFRDWAAESQKASLLRYEAITEALAEQHSHEAKQYDDMIAKLDAIIANVTGDRPEPANG